MLIFFIANGKCKRYHTKGYRGGFQFFRQNHGDSAPTGLVNRYSAKRSPQAEVQSRRNLRKAKGGKGFT